MSDAEAVTPVLDEKFNVVSPEAVDWSLLQQEPIKEVPAKEAMPYAMPLPGMYLVRRGELLYPVDGQEKALVLVGKLQAARGPKSWRLVVVQDIVNSVQAEDVKPEFKEAIAKKARK